MSSSKRLLIVAGAVAIGFTGAFAFAPAASAEGRIGFRDTASACLEGGGVQLTWSLQNNNGQDYTLTDVSRPGIKGIANGVTLPQGNTLNGDEIVSAAEYDKKVELKVTVVDSSGAKEVVTGTKKVPNCGKGPGGGQVVAPGNSGTGLSNQPNPSKVEPIAVTRTCDAAEITVTNTESKDVRTTLKVGNDAKEETLAPGGTTKIRSGWGNQRTATFNVTIGGVKQDVKYTAPTNCGTALAMTGTNTALIAGAAVLLVGTGAGLFLAARRRRIRFSA